MDIKKTEKAVKNMPEVSPGDKIYIGKKREIKAVVCNLGSVGSIHVVYCVSGQYVNTGAIWTGEYWEVDKNSGFGYADKYPDLIKFVNILRGWEGKSLYRFKKGKIIR